MTKKLPVEKGLELNGGKKGKDYDIIRNVAEFDDWKNVTISVDYISEIIYLEYHSIHEENGEEYEIYHKKEFIILEYKDNEPISITPKNQSRIGSRHEQIMNNSIYFNLN